MIVNSVSQFTTPTLLTKEQQQQRMGQQNLLSHKQDAF